MIELLSSSNETSEVFSYNGTNVTMRNANGIVYVNLTEFAKAFPNKNLSTIINSQEITDYCEALSKLQNFSFADLLIVKRGAPELGGGTWAHQKVALRVAQKLSPEFAVWVDTKIEELLTHGETSMPRPMTQAEFILQQAQLLVENERKMKELEEKTDEIKSDLAKVIERTTTDLHCSTIVAYVTRNNIKLDVRKYGVMGRKASKICSKRGLHVTKINDVRWGRVSVYPDEVLDEVFSGKI